MLCSACPPECPGLSLAFLPGGLEGQGRGNPEGVGTAGPAYRTLRSLGSSPSHAEMSQLIIQPQNGLCGGSRAQSSQGQGLKEETDRRGSTLRAGLQLGPDCGP